MRKQRNGDAIILNSKKICIFGNDKRMKYLCPLFQEAGCLADHFQSIQEDEMPKADIYVFPVGTETSTINKFIEKNPNSLFFVGNSVINNKNVFDYFKDEAVTIKNTIPTAEGTIAMAINETEETLFGSRCLVLGYGKVAKTLSSYLGCFGAKVTIAARKETDRVLAAINSFNTIELNELISNVENFDIIINTIPAKIIDSSILKRIRNQSLIIDLASKPGGVDFKEAETLGKKVIWALGLPGKVAPKTAAEYIFKYIIETIYERNK